MIGRERITARPQERTPDAVGWSPDNRPALYCERKVKCMTVKDELILISKGYSRAEIKEMKEREKTEVEEPEKEEPEKEEPEKEEPENVSRETSKKGNPTPDEMEDAGAEALHKIKELEAQLAKAQEDNTHRDNSGEVDNRSDFQKCVDIFKDSF